MVIHVQHIYISPGHNYFGHYGKPAGENEIIEKDEIECVAGKGIMGDRFFDYKKDYKGQITFFSMEVFAGLCESLNLQDAAPAATRRNVMTSGVDLNSLIGQEFEIQGIQFEGVCECSPCFWMDQAFAAGAEEFLKGQGGLRAKILTDGTLRADV